MRIWVKGTQRVLATLSNYISKHREVDLASKKGGHYLREIDRNVNLIDFDSSRSVFSFLSY